MYNGHKVTVRETYSYAEQEEVPSFEGIVMETMRDQYGTITGLYVLSIDERGCGIVTQAPLQRVVFHDGERLEKEISSIKSQNKDIFAQTLGMMLGGVQNLEA